MFNFLTGTTIDMETMMSSITGGLGAFSTDNLIIIIAAVLGITVGPVLFWFGYNFAKRKLMGAVKKGRL